MRLPDGRAPVRPRRPHDDRIALIRQSGERFVNVCGVPDGAPASEGRAAVRIPRLKQAGRQTDHRLKKSANVFFSGSASVAARSSGALNNGLPGDHSSTLSACSS